MSVQYDGNAAAASPGTLLYLVFHSSILLGVSKLETGLRGDRKCFIMSSAKMAVKYMPHVPDLDIVSKSDSLQRPMLETETL